MAVDNENENRIFRAMREKDFETLKEFLKNPDCHRLSFQRKPILSVAVTNFNDPELVKFLIVNDCDLREADITGNTAFHDLILRHPTTANDDDEKKSWSTIFNILLAARSDVVEFIFLNANQKKMTPFLLACERGCGDVIMRFLALLGNNSISLDHFIGDEGNNVFHFLGECKAFFTSPSPADTVRALVEKIPMLEQLIDAKDDFGWSPLHPMFYLCVCSEYQKVMDEVAKIFLRYGASPDGRYRSGMSYLEIAVLLEKHSFVELLLRAGCNTRIFQYESPLSRALRKGKSRAFPIIELLLAFGYDLQQELYLYTIDERPIEFNSREYAARRDTTGMEPRILVALQEIRRSNKMLSLKRQCRNTIRRHLKYKADEVIENLTCIPPSVKSFLLVENETPLLGIQE